MIVLLTSQKLRGGAVWCKMKISVLVMLNLSNSGGPRQGCIKGNWTSGIGPGRAEGAIDLGVILTKMKVKALGVDEISIYQKGWREKNLE